MGGRSLFRCILCIAIPYRFQVGCPKNLECKTAKVLRDLNPPIESKLSVVDSSHVILCSFAFQVWMEQATKNTVLTYFCNVSHQATTHSGYNCLQRVHYAPFMKILDLRCLYLCNSLAVHSNCLAPFWSLCSPLRTGSITLHGEQYCGLAL